MHELEERQMWVQILALPFNYLVTLGKALDAELLHKVVVNINDLTIIKKTSSCGVGTQ